MATLMHTTARRASHNRDVNGVDVNLGVAQDTIVDGLCRSPIVDDFDSREGLRVDGLPRFGQLQRRTESVTGGVS